MTIIFRFIFILSVICCSTSCHNTESDTDYLAAAESALNDGYYTEAQQICNKLTERTGIDNLPVDVRCRLALVYMKLAEQRNESENTAAAIECYRTALVDSPDSATQAFTDLPVEDMQYAMILSSLTAYATGDSLIIFDHEGDSLFIDPDINHNH
ncbi:MAG: hypothetical protein K2M65_01020 [Muribaculaceae bacterium]|nr:hypothetical protein [Muribaculaceae bacterium]